MWLPTTPNGALMSKPVGRNLWCFALDAEVSLLHDGGGTNSYWKSSEGSSFFFQGGVVSRVWFLLCFEEF